MIGSKMQASHQLQALKAGSLSVTILCWAVQVQTEVMGDIHHYAWRARLRNHTVYIHKRDGERFGDWASQQCSVSTPFLPYQMSFARSWLAFLSKCLPVTMFELQPAIFSIPLLPTAPSFALSHGHVGDCREKSVRPIPYTGLTDMPIPCLGLTAD